MAKHITSHLRAYRRRWGLSQGELAFMVGLKSRSVLSEFESSGKLPTLITALAIYCVFDTPVAELFPSLYQEIEDGVLARAYDLYERLQGDPSRATRIKLDFLEELIERVEKRRATYGI
jgi:DNA-binding XRE family transcriptional regulator